MKDAGYYACKAPVTFEDCLIYARKKFEKYFVNDVKQLLYVYPLDKMTKEGNPFWTLPKRAPTPAVFDFKNETYVKFIVSFACLRANLYSIKIDDGVKDKALANDILGKVFKDLKLKEWKPDESKAKEILESVEKDKKEEKPEEKIQEKADEKMDEKPDEKIDEKPDEKMDEKPDKTITKKEEEVDTNSYEYILQLFVDNIKDLDSKKIKPEEFEKDNDKNFHIDSIYSMANIRGSIYKLDYMDWMTVKIKAGRIIPALATTTAAIAGLQTVEYVKILKDIELEHFKNSFLNIAVPILTQGEPGPVPTVTIHDSLKITLWDRWDIKDCEKRKLKLVDLIDIIKKDYGVFINNVFRGTMALYTKGLSDGQILEKNLIDLLQLQTGEHCDLTVACTLSEQESTDIIKQIPNIRIFY